MQKNNKYKSLNIAVIGCGNWGKNHIRVLHELGALYCVNDSDPFHASLFSNEYEVPSNSLEKILANEKINGVIIASPAATHFKIAKACLQAGKHTFVEKPLAFCPQEAKELHKISQECNRILMVGHLLQYHSAFKTLKQLQQDGTLGQLQYLYSNRLNLGKFRTEENILWSFAPHDVSMILSLVGSMPKTVAATGAKYLQHTVADITCTHLNFPNNEQAHIFVSWLHPLKEQKLVIVGEKGMATFDDGKDWSEKLTIHPYPVEWVDGLPQPSKSKAKNINLPPTEPLKDEQKHFLDCILENKIPFTDGKEGIRVLQVLNAAERSMQEKKPVTLEETQQKHAATT